LESLALFACVAIPALVPRKINARAGKKYCSHPAGNIWKRAFWCFGFVSAQSQAAVGMLLRQSLAKTPKIPAPNGYSIFLTALMFDVQR
jgi:hypothetical protein